MRLALIYALLDCAPAIQLCHLEAGLEVWRYAYESARYIFGDSLGDPKADEALTLVRASPGGVTRSELGVRLFGKHATAEGLNRILEVLRKTGLVESRNEPTDGRSAERWFATSSGGEEVKGGKGSASDGLDSESIQ